MRRSPLDDTRLLRMIAVNGSASSQDIRAVARRRLRQLAAQGLVFWHPDREWMLTEKGAAKIAEPTPPFAPAGGAAS